MKNLNFTLKSCVWEITLKCCFECKYCGSGGGKARPEELTTMECMDVIRQLAGLGCRRVSLIGGEVFLRPDWYDIVNSLINYGIRVAIITNGYIFTAPLIDKIHTLGIESVAVSLDGPKDVHDRYRQHGSFERADKAIDALSEHGISVSVISTLNHENSQRLEEFYKYLTTKRIKAWQIQACSPMGNAVRSGVEYTFDFLKVVDFVDQHVMNAPFAIGLADNIGYFTGSDDRIRGGAHGFTGCRAGLDTVGIDSVGCVRGCESMYDDRFVEGDLRHSTLKEIWESPDSFTYNRKFNAEMLTGKCAQCTYGKYCGGGCRSYNYFTSGKLYESMYCARKED